MSKEHFKPSFSSEHDTVNNNHRTDWGDLIQKQPEGATTWESLADFTKTVAETSISPEQGAIQSLVERRKDYEQFMSEFQVAIDAGTEAEDLDKNNREIQNIRRFFSVKIESGDPLSVQEIATVLYALKDRGDNEGVISVFEAGQGFGLDKSATLKEFYAVSLNKVGRLEDSITVLNELVNDDNARTGEVAGILGKVRKLQSERATDIDEKIEYMRESVDILRDGFYQTYEYYPGINLVYNQIELANLEDNPDLITKAFDDAELVMYATKKAGAENTSDYWAAATLLEASVFAGDVTPQTIERCISTSKHDWELESTLGNLRKVADTIDKQLQSANVDEATARRLSQVRELIIGNDEQDGVIHQLESGKAVEGTEMDHNPKDDILSSGFMYGETTTLIGGNIKFGGQLQDHIVNRFDVRTAYAVLEFYGLDQVDNVDGFNDAIDPIIRQQFDTASLEDLHSSEHEVYDTQIKNLLEITGVNDLDRANVDTRTNVMMDFLLGKGDCRQHAYAKQLLFDSWKTFQLNNLIGSLKDVQEDDDPAERERIKSKIDELLSKQLFVFDSTISSKVKMNGLYDPQFQDGKYIESDNYEDIEDHTWNGLVTFDKDGHVASLEMADSFYQDEYGLGGKHQILTNVEDYTRGGLVVTAIQALNQETGQIDDVPVRLKPTVYAGNRAGRGITKHADDGAAYVRGINLGYYVDGVIKTIGSPEVKDFWKAIAA